MLRVTRLILCFAVLLPAGFCLADGPKDNRPDDVRRVPRLGIEVSEEKRAELEQAMARLRKLIDKVAASDDQRLVNLVPDLEIYYRAAHDALKHQEFFKPKEINDALKLLEFGKVRASLLLSRDGIDRAAWTENPKGGLVVRGYRSKIDHSVQPYGLVIPESYAHNGRKARLDVWFHGRNESVSENVFLTQRMNKKGVFAPQDTIVLHPYGRYSNAFKFAGEVDVLEAIEHVRQNYNIDDERISVRGFSMGGAACWQFAVHYPDRWFAANPGAGFSETPEFLKFFQQEKLDPTWYEEKLWRMYDCNLWAKNLLHCPTIAYSGEDDIQRQAADIMETALDEVGVKLTHIIGPKTGHKYHPDSAAEVARRMDELAVAGRDRMPLQIDLVTYTLKYNRMHWIKLDALEEHWEPATVTAGINPTEPKIDLKVNNVSELTVDIPAGHWPHPVNLPVQVLVNGESIAAEDGGLNAMSDRSFRFTLHASDSKWQLGGRGEAELRKRHNLQGPIDDAFMDSFIFVRPTGQSKNTAVADWANSELERAIEHWRRHFRGDARVKNDVEVTDEDIASANLILWGDPQNNRLIGRIADKLPIEWNEQRIKVGDEEHAAGEHGLIAIYPNPLNQQRYVVLNSSFTFREFAYLNNARQVSKLPDWAVVDVSVPPDALWPGKIAAANFFDDRWQLKK